MISHYRSTYSKIIYSDTLYNVVKYKFLYSYRLEA